MMISTLHLRSRGPFVAWIVGWVLFQAAAAFAVANEAAIDLSSLERIEVQPQKIQLHGPRDRAIVLVTGYLPGGVVVDLTRQAQITSSDAKIVASQNAEVSPTGDGHCELTVQVGTQKASLPVVVSGFGQPAPISFRTETVAALTRQGCNSGACHGSPSGKGGFQLSLLAYDQSDGRASLSLKRKKADASIASNRKIACCCLSPR